MKDKLQNCFETNIFLSGIQLAIETLLKNALKMDEDFSPNIKLNFANFQAAKEFIARITRFLKCPER